MRCLFVTMGLNFHLILIGGEICLLLLYNEINYDDELKFQLAISG